MQIKMARVALAVVTAALLAACAGGGGGGGGGTIAVSPPVSPPPVTPPPPPPPPPPPLGTGVPSATSAEYLRGYAVADTKARTAWENGATGAGVLVAVIDDGVDATHPELAGRISAASKDINASRNQLFSINDTHGSELAAIIAGNYNNSQTIGLAYNATVLAVRADNGNEGFNSNDLANSVDYAIAQGAKVINFSLGSSTPSSSQFQAAISRATAAGIIIVVSAGNDGALAPEVNYPGFFATDPSVSRNLIMVAGAHNSSGQLVSFSNRAGQAKDFYLTAPGLEIIVPDFAVQGPTDPAFQVCFDDLTCRVQGTSYSAPYLTGAVALVRGAFPGMTPQQIVQLLLNSADDFGDPGVDAVSGHGRLNIARAFGPVGMVAAPLAFGGADVPVSMPLGISGAAFGDGLTLTPGLWTTVGFDAYGRTFGVDLARNWRGAGAEGVSFEAPAVWRNAETPGGYATFTQEDVTPPETLRASFDARDVSPGAFRVESALSERTRVAFSANTPALQPMSAVETRGHLGFAGTDVSVAVIQSLGRGAELALTSQSGATPLGQDFGDSTRSAMAARLSQTAGAFAGAVTVGSLHETGAQLGLGWSPRVGVRPDSDTGFVALEGVWRGVDGLSFSAEAEVGRSRSEAGGFLSVATPLTTTAFALGATVDATPAWAGEDARGRFVLSLRQPLRVEGGALSVALPTADAWGRMSLGYETRTFDPAPSGRERDVEAAYDLFVTGHFSARLGVAHIVEPGHRRDADPETRAHIGVRLNY